MATTLWHNIQGYVLLPLGILLHSLWHTLGHPIETFYVLLSAFDGRYYGRHIDFRMNRYYGRLTRARMRSDLRSALVDTFLNPRDAIVAALGQAVSRWRRWCRRDRGPLYAVFDEFAVETVEATTGRRAKVWTQDRFAAFVASRLGGSDSGAAPILWRSFCYNALYPFTLSLAACPAEDRRLGLNDWVQAVAMLATGAADNVHYARPVYSITGTSIWYEFACLAVRSRPQHRLRSVPSDASSDAKRPPTVLEQVAYVASAQLPLDYAIRGPRLPEILPHVRKLVNGAECEPIIETYFAIPYQDILCLFGAVLQVYKPDLDAARWNKRLDENRGLSLATDIDRATHLAVAKQILAVAGVYDEDDDSDSTISYKQYDALRNKLDLKTNEPWHRGESWSFSHELGLLWRSLFSVFSIVDDLKGLNHNSLGNDETRNHPPPPLLLQALDFLYPLPSCGCTRQSRRKNTLLYTSEAGGLSREGVVAALTKYYRPGFVVLYGHTADESRQPAIFAVMMSSPLWCTCYNGRIDDFFVDDKHLLIEIAPRARVLQYQLTKNKHNKTIFTDLVDVDDAADTISFGSRSGLTLNLAAGVATLFSAAEPVDSGHYVEIPAGPRTKAPEAIASPAVWTTSMHITKLEVYMASDGVDEDLAIMRGLRRISRRQAAEERRSR